MTGCIIKLRGLCLNQQCQANSYPDCDFVAGYAQGIPHDEESSQHEEHLVTCPACGLEFDPTLDGEDEYDDE